MKLDETSEQAKCPNCHHEMARTHDGLWLCGPCLRWFNDELAMVFPGPNDTTLGPVVKEINMSNGSLCEKCASSIPEPSVFNCAYHCMTDVDEYGAYHWCNLRGPCSRCGELHRVREKCIGLECGDHAFRGSILRRLWNWISKD